LKVRVTNAAEIGMSAGTSTGSQLAPLLAQLQGGGAGLPGAGGSGGMKIPGGADLASWGIGQAFGAAAGGISAGAIPLLDMITGGAISGGIGDALKGIGSLLGFASGGNPPVGRASWVGERGPELFVPHQSGTILTHDASRRILESGGGAGGDTYNVQNMTINDQADRDRIKSWNRERTQRKLRLV